MPDRKSRKKEKKKNIKKDEFTQRSNMLEYFEKSLLCNISFKNYLEDLDSTLMNFELGSKYQDVNYLINANLDTFKDNLDKNSFGFGIKGQLFFLNYDLTINFGGKDTIYTIANLDYDIIDNKRVNVKKILNFEGAFNENYENYDLKLGADISSKFDELKVGAKISKIVVGNMNSDNGIDKSLDGYSLIPYADFILDNKRGTKVYSGYELLNKKFNNQKRNYNNFNIELSLVKDETLVLGL